MTLTKNKLYTILLAACFTGYTWLYYNMISSPIGKKSIGVCMIKEVTNTPCPSCGSTRAIQSFFEGNYKQSLLINPLGIIIILTMIIVPIWILIDFIYKSNSLQQSYIKIENQFKKPKIAVLFIILIIANWIWNITKGL